MYVSIPNEQGNLKDLKVKCWSLSPKGENTKQIKEDFHRQDTGESELERLKQLLDQKVRLDRKVSHSLDNFKQEFPNRTPEVEEYVKKF